MSDFSGTGATRRFESLVSSNFLARTQSCARRVKEPTPPRSLLALLAALKPLEEDFPPIPDHAPDPVDL
jgi:hypothetical protein